MHETVLEYRLCHNTSSFRNKQKRHHLRLHVCWESWVWQCFHIHRFKRLIRNNAHTIFLSFNLNAHFLQFGDNRPKMIRNCTFNKNVAARHRCSDHKRSCFYTIRNYCMFYTTQLFDTFDTNNTRTCSTNDCTHTIQVISKVNDFRLFSCIFNDGCTFR
ncbi:hypothetical protein D1872_228770 [compost metagenome]